eukprot:TRINITY_DN12561_c0_g1_i3.p1 TRINITY_DN12561_c0_g1~~TRINITY_DN12561_c0_g1_i3.p1  ORF type:complete len:255 (+),score=79.79 TRINITY_DN12561_c0_g1_i3:161-925(+)
MDNGMPVIKYINVTKGTNFSTDRKLVEVFYNNYYIDNTREYGTLYALYPNMGFLYARNFTAENYEFVPVPMTGFRYDFQDIFADDSLVLVHEGSIEGNFIHCYLMDNGTVVPKFKLTFNKFNISSIDNMWTERIPQSEITKYSSFHIYIKSNRTIYSFDVFPDPIFIVGKREVESNKAVIRIKSPLEETKGKVEICIEGHKSVTRSLVAMVVIMVALLLGVTILFGLVKKKSEKREKNGKNERRKSDLLNNKKQ